MVQQEVPGNHKQSLRADPYGTGNGKLPVCLPQHIRPLNASPELLKDRVEIRVLSLHKREASRVCQESTET